MGNFRLGFLALVLFFISNVAAMKRSKSTTRARKRHFPSMQRSKSSTLKTLQQVHSFCQMTKNCYNKLCRGFERRTTEEMENVEQKPSKNDLEEDEILKENTRKIFKN